jgi:arylsulfatase A-like enzyme
MIRERPAERTVTRALAWLDEWRGGTPRQPFLLWVHLFDPHQPYNLRSRDLAAVAPTPYDAEIAEADRGVGRLIDWLRRQRMLDATLVVLTADHGESLEEHGEPTHGIFIYDATIRVPLIWRLPGIFAANATYGGPVRHIDILPTVLDVLGLPGGDATQGTEPPRGAPGTHSSTRPGAVLRGLGWQRKVSGWPRCSACGTTGASGIAAPRPSSTTSGVIPAS